MRISHKHKFVFFAIPKTGSTSIRQHLNSYSDIRGTDRVESPLYWHGKPPALKKYFEKQQWNWNKYFKFTFVRNTWARILSMYIYRSKRYAELHGADCYTKEYPDQGRWLVEATPDNFRSYLKMAPYSAGRQTTWADDCDFVGKLENLQQDFSVVCDKIGVPQQQLQHINISKHKHYTEYYDDETRDIVATAYMDEITKYRFKFHEEVC